MKGSSPVSYTHLNSEGNLQDYWDVIEKYPSLQGGHSGTDTTMTAFHILSVLPHKIAV